MIENKIDKSEIESLEKAIKKIENKTLLYYVGLGFGVLIVIIDIFYYFKNPTVVGGTLALGFIGVLVIVLNIISLNQAKKRIEELNKDLKLIKERYSKKND